MGRLGLRRVGARGVGIRALFWRHQLQSRIASPESVEVWKRFCERSGLSKLDSLRAVSSCALRSGESAIPLDSSDPDTDFRDDVEQVVIGDPGEVVVTCFRNGDVEIAEFEVTWHGQMPVPGRRPDRRVVVARDTGADERARRVASAIMSLRSRRLRQFRRCIKCKEWNPPEWWSGDGYCQSCAQEYRGVVY